MQARYPRQIRTVDTAKLTTANQKHGHRQRLLATGERVPGYLTGDAPIDIAGNTVRLTPKADMVANVPRTASISTGRTKSSGKST